MKTLIKPQRLQKGDTVATVSLSWGGAGDESVNWRYNQGKKRLEEVFGLHVVEMKHTLAGTDYVYNNPQSRAEDFMNAFRDPDIKGIFSCIGGDDTIRILPYIDFDVIRNNPKVFIGYSDTTVNHYMCYKAGLSSFYGAAILSDFAENVALPQYTADNIFKTLFSGDIIGDIRQSDTWSGEHLAWKIENINTARHFTQNDGYTVTQGSGTASGHLIGGCIEVFDWLRGTSLFPDISDFDGAVLFFETSEEQPLPAYYKYVLRTLGAMGVLSRINGMLIGKPKENKYFSEYNDCIRKVLHEYGRDDMPVLSNASFGHNEPKCCIPFGAMCKIDCTEKTFSILESGVL